jgi:hypothetical protein
VTDVFASQTQTLSAIEVARTQLSTGNDTQEAAHKLIDNSKDILSQALDDQVCFHVAQQTCLFIMLSGSTNQQ